uniref:Nodule-specific cysteine-rich peptide G17 n=1 Tax=Pisum sativum TaxID=3888 RepID=A0A7T8DV54_PEA|nr:nodule-specific cysteine-rich peptide G17 [Pisum sativum]
MSKLVNFVYAIVLFLFLFLFSAKAMYPCETKEDCEIVFVSAGKMGYIVDCIETCVLFKI